MSNKLMQVESNSNGARIRQYGSNGQSNQIFSLEAVDDSYYKVISQSANKVWEAAGGGSSDGTAIQLADWNNTDRQKWVLVDAGSGSYKLQPKYTSAYVIDVEGGNSNDGNPLSLYGPHGGDNQAFYFISVSCGNTPVCPSPRDPENPSGTVAGLNYKFYAGNSGTTNWCATSSLAGLTPSSTGNVTNFSLSPKTQNEYMGFEFSGYLDVPTEGQYTFYFLSDDAGTLYIGNQAVVTYEGCHGMDAEQTGTICLKAGRHAIKVLMAQGAGDYGLSIKWSSSGISKQDIPDSRLFRSASGATCAGTGTGLTGSYFNNFNVFGSPQYIRTDATIDFSWGNSSPVPGIINDDFSVRWEGQIEAPESGLFTFRTNNDDGTRVWINNEPVIVDWTDHGPTWKSGTIELDACQKYNIKIEYYDSGYGAQAQLFWSYGEQAEQIVPQSRLYPTVTSGCTPPTVSATQIGTSNSYQLTASCSSGSISWSHGLGTSSQVTVSPTSTTTYTATCTAGACSSSANVTVTVSGTSVCSAEYQAFYGNSSESYTYTVNVSTAGTYTVKVNYRFAEGTVATGGVKVNGGTVQTLSLPNTSGNYQDMSFTATLQAGANTFTFSGGNTGNYGTKKVCVEVGDVGCTTPADPTITPTSASYQYPGSANLTATCPSGSTLSWSHGLGGSSGVAVNVSPSSTTTYTATCTATVGSCTSSKNVTVTVTSPPASNCYEFYLASNGKRITNTNGVVKVSSQANNLTQSWKVENDGSYIKLIVQDGTNRVLGVANGGNSIGNIITLQTDNGGDHQRWTKQLVSDSNPGDKYGFIRKNSSLIIHSEPNWGDGSSDPAVPDLKLTDGSDLNVFGRNKFYQSSVGCSSNNRMGLLETVINEEFDQTLLVSPNPNEGLFHVSFYLEKGKKATLQVLDLKGRVVRSTGLVGQGQHRERFELQNAANGTYLVVLRRPDGTKTKKVVIIK
jgi:hypothetical protein